MKNDSYAYHGSFSPAYLKYLDQDAGVRRLVESNWSESESWSYELTCIIISFELRLATQDK